MKMPALGSPEAAVQAAVNLLAAVTKLDERKLAYWLDMYYQLRDVYEAAKAEERLEALKAENAAKCQLRTFVTYDPPAPDAMQNEAEDQTEEAADAALEPEVFAAPEVPDGFVSVPVPESPAAKAAQEKRRIRERFMQARANGVTLGAIRKAANGGITEESLRDIIESKPVPVAVYRVLDKTLDQMEQ